MAPSIVGSVQSRLNVIAAAHPEMVEAVEYYQRLVPALNAAASRMTPIKIAAETQDRKFASGVPLLVGETLELNARDCRETFLEICQAIQPPDQANQRARALKKIVSNINSGDLDPISLLSAVDCGDRATVKQYAQRLGLDTQLVEVLAHNTLKAFFRAWRAGFERQVNLETWQGSICPFCGAAPALAEIQGVEGARHLRCLACGCDWPYPNLKCAFCGNDDAYTLGILFIESEAHIYYAHACDRCRRYIKTIITFEPTPVDLLMVEDLETLHLDRLALEKGYR
jgi:FdhE protein